MSFAMKKLLTLFMVLFLAASCSWLNPFGGKGEEKPAAYEPNKFLWQAAKEKLSFATIEKEDRQAGVLVAEWEQFRIDVKVLSPLLRADCLRVDVYSKSEKTAEALDDKLEMAIFNRARVLYRESLNIK